MIITDLDILLLHIFFFITITKFCKVISVYQVTYTYMKTHTPTCVCAFVNFSGYVSMSVYIYEHVSTCYVYVCLCQYMCGSLCGVAVYVLIHIYAAQFHFPIKSPKFQLIF